MKIIIAEEHELWNKRNPTAAERTRLSGSRKILGEILKERTLIAAIVRAEVFPLEIIFTHFHLSCQISWLFHTAGHQHCVKILKQTSSVEGSRAHRFVPGRV